jgi:hypothetical protein
MAKLESRRSPECQAKQTTRIQSVDVTWERTGAAGADILLWVSVAKIDENWRKCGDGYIGPRGSSNTKPGAYEGFAQWVQAGYPVGMPEISYFNGFVQFSNGRHRFAFFRDRGMVAMQVQVDPAVIKIVTRLFSTTERKSSWVAPDASMKS